MQHSLFENRIGRVTVCFPTAIQKIDFDATAKWIAAIYPNCSVAKITACFAIPCTKLNNIDFVTGGGNEAFAEISSEPAGLRLELCWNRRRDVQGTLANEIRIAQL